MKIMFFNQHVERFIADLEKPILAKTLRTLDLLERFGIKLGMPHSKKIDNNLFELRIRSKKEIRIFYAFHKKKVIILLHIFIKKTQRISKRQMNLAKNRLKSLDHL